MVDVPGHDRGMTTPPPTSTTVTMIGRGDTDHLREEADLAALHDLSAGAMLRPALLDCFQGTEVLRPAVVQEVAR